MKMCTGSHENVTLVSVKHRRNGIAIRQGQCSEEKSQIRDTKVG